MSRLSKNIISNMLGQGLLLILGFVAVKYVFKQLGEDALGIIYFTLTMNAVLCAVLEMGICSTTVREVSSHFHDEPGYIRDLIRTASLFYWGAYILLAVVIYFGAPVLVEKWVNLRTMDGATATRALQILGIASVVTLPQRFYASLFRGLQRMEFNNVIDVATVGLQQFGIIAILVLGGSLFHVVYWFVVCFGFSILMYLFASAHFFSWQAMIPWYSPVAIRRNLGYSLNMMFISILAMIHTQADKVILSKLLPIGTLAYYSFSYSLTTRASVLTEGISQAVFPSFSALFRVGDRIGLMMQYRKLHDLVCLATVPLFAAILFSSVPLFTYVFNGEIAKMLLLPVVFLCVGSYMHGALYVPYIFSIAAGKPEISVKSNFLALFIVLPVTGISIYFFGLAGAGFSWVFYHLFSYAYTVPRICSECLEVPIKEWYVHIGKILGVAGLTYGIAWASLGFLGAHSILALALAYMGASAMFVLEACWLMSEELRAVLLRLAQALRMRMAEVT